MPKLKLILLSILVSTSAFAQQDPPTISELKEKITLLETKVDVLNDANKKILRTVIGTLGIILTFFVGMGVANYFSNKRLNEQKFDNYTSGLNEKFSQLEEAINKQVSSLQSKIESNTINQNEKIIERVASSTEESKEVIVKQLNKTVQNELQKTDRLEAMILKNKLKLIEMRHYTNYSTSQDSYLSKDTKFQRVIEMCRLANKLDEFPYYFDDISLIIVNSYLMELNNFLSENEITPKMNSELNRLFEKLSESTYGDNIGIIKKNIRIDNSMSLI